MFNQTHQVRPSLISRVHTYLTPGIIRTPQKKIGNLGTLIKFLMILEEEGIAENILNAVC